MRTNNIDHGIALDDACRFVSDGHDTRVMNLARAYMDYANRIEELVTALENIAASRPDSEMKFEPCGCDEAEAWMTAARKRKELARDALASYRKVT